MSVNIHVVAMATTLVVVAISTIGYIMQPSYPSFGTVVVGHSKSIQDEGPCQRRCKDRPSIIEYRNLKDTAGLEDRLLVIEFMGRLASDLCATVLFPKPCKMLTWVHNKQSEPVSCGLKWDFFFDSRFKDGTPVLAESRTTLNTSMRPHDGGTGLFIINSTMGDSTAQINKVIDTFQNNGTFHWVVSENVYPVMDSTAGIAGSLHRKLVHEDRGRHYMNYHYYSYSNPHAGSANSSIGTGTASNLTVKAGAIRAAAVSADCDTYPHPSILVEDSPYVRAVRDRVMRRLNISTGSFYSLHLRRPARFCGSEGTNKCDNKPPAVKSYLQCSLQGCSSASSILVFTDITDHDYLGSIAKVMPSAAGRLIAADAEIQHVISRIISNNEKIVLDVHEPTVNTGTRSSYVSENGSAPSALDATAYAARLRYADMQSNYFVYAVGRSMHREARVHFVRRCTTHCEPCDPACPAAADAYREARNASNSNSAVVNNTLPK